MNHPGDPTNGGAPRRRDTTRSRLYAAEDQVGRILSTGGTIEFFGSNLTVPAERKFGDVDSIGPYLAKVLAFAPVAALERSTVPLLVRERRGATKAHYETIHHDGRYTGVIAVPPYRRGAWALRETVVLHELAHHLAGDGHGPTFVATLVHLYEHVIAPEAAHMLRVAAWEQGLSIAEELT